MSDLLGDDPSPPSPMSAEGHRKRLRARLLSAGPESVADHELLELVLFLALPRRDTKPIARALLARFGSFAGSVAAPLSELRGVDGLGDAGAAALNAEVTRQSSIIAYGNDYYLLMLLALAMLFLLPLMKRPPRAAAADPAHAALD